MEKQRDHKNSAKEQALGRVMVQTLRHSRLDLQGQPNENRRYAPIGPEPIRFESQYPADHHQPERWCARSGNRRFNSSLAAKILVILLIEKLGRGRLREGNFMSTGYRD